ncbi:hypothetical protein F1559_005126 [Cyanidiococcus yangmingshanensis]|uniref:Uncharacterized protein n=1 Tax=Cyanidiococcus yangmingshanensis TaxID=2690220 RepID=A0A7J7IQX1_9RHOD|nr:hypothetical protein F1559_005126 [Cyanidiococcus yangmingshanensis]
MIPRLARLARPRDECSHSLSVSDSTGFIVCLGWAEALGGASARGRSQLKRGLRNEQRFTWRLGRSFGKSRFVALRMHQPQDQSEEKGDPGSNKQPARGQWARLRHWRTALHSRLWAGLEAMGRVEAILFFFFPERYLRNLIYERDPAAPSLIVLWYEMLWEYAASRYEEELRRQSFLARPLGCLLRYTKRDVFSRERRVKKLRALRQYRCRRCRNAKVVQCERCKGTGIDPYAWDACPRCRATGKHPCPLCCVNKPMFPSMPSRD